VAKLRLSPKRGKPGIGGKRLLRISGKKIKSKTGTRLWKALGALGRANIFLFYLNTASNTHIFPKNDYILKCKL
jgi:hypothetical protein